MNGEEVTGQGDDGNDFVVFMNRAKPFSLDYVLPHKAVFQVDKDVYLLERIPARQYKRGLCSDNTSISRVGISERPMRINLSFELLQKFTCKQDYFTLKQALAGKDTNNAYALNSRMSYHKSGAIYVDKICIANYSSGTFTVLPQFKEDVERLVALDPFTTTIK